MLTIDYGYEMKELYSPKRSQGTLQTYYKHTSGSSPYQWIGRQDITAHVDFTTVIEEGRAVGLRPLCLMTQAEYLDRLGLKKWAAKLRNRDMSARNVRSNAMGMRDLADPEGLGGFKVLIQERATCLRDVDGVFPSPNMLSSCRCRCCGAITYPCTRVCIQLIRGSWKRRRGTSERERCLGGD